MENENIKFLKFKYLSYDKTKLKDKITKENNNYFFYVNIILLIINILLILNLFKFNDLNNFKNNFISDLGNYSLYNFFKYPQISILIYNINNLNLNGDNYIIDFITMLRTQKLNDIEVLFSLPNEISDNFNIIKKYCKLDNRIKIYINNKENNLNNLFDLIEQAKGKFIIIMNKFEIFDFFDLEKFYNLTKGNINNIFTFYSSKGNDIYLIKSKIVRDVIDRDLSFQNVSDFINYILPLPESPLNYVSIALSPDNYYSSYTYVSMLSILNSKNYLTYISFYLIITEDFEQKSIDFLNSLYDQFDLFNITFLKMDKRYDVAYISRYLTKQTYYRFSIGKLIPYLNRIIYLDTDTIVYNDLNEFYNLNFNRKIILGQPTFFNKSKRTGILKINNGVLLLNLKMMRNLHIEEKVLYILNNGFKNDYHDQFLLNQFFYEFIGIFPPKYHIRPWNDYNELKLFNKQSGNVYDNDYLYFSCKYPTILHYAYNAKPIFSNITNSEDWWYFARKSKYFSEKTENLSIIFNYTYD